MGKHRRHNTVSMRLLWACCISLLVLAGKALKIYIPDLPSKYNADIIAKRPILQQMYSNPHGDLLSADLGLYNSNQFSNDAVFYTELLKSPLRTFSVGLAQKGVRANSGSPSKFCYTRTERRGGYSVRALSGGSGHILTRGGQSGRLSVLLERDGRPSADVSDTAPLPGVLLPLLSNGFQHLLD